MHGCYFFRGWFWWGKAKKYIKDFTSCQADELENSIIKMSQLGIGKVRSPINEENLKKFLEKFQENVELNQTTKGHNPLPKINPSTLEVQQFKFGQSNPTYFIRDTSSDTKFVLRRKPSPNNKLVSKSAHAIEREFFILNGISICNETTDKKVPVPKVYLLCEDEGVIDYVFYLMEYIDGRQIVNPGLPGIPSEEKSKYWDSIMETITAIHSLNTKILIENLPASHFPQFQPEKLSKPSKSTYFQRQVRTLTSVASLQSKVVEPIPHFAQICEWLLKNSPEDPTKPTLIHGDCKIDNVIFDHNSPKIISVLDWELCTFGHPLFDLANFLQPYQLPNRLNLLLYKPDKTNLGREIPDSINQLYEKLDLYQQKLQHNWQELNPKNNPQDTWNVGFVFGLLRLCVISQGIAMRVSKGNASSDNASGYASLYPYLASLAIETIEEDSKTKSSHL